MQRRKNIEDYFLCVFAPLRLIKNYLIDARSMYLSMVIAWYDVAYLVLICL